MKLKDGILAGLSGVAGYLVADWYYGHRLEEAKNETKEARENTEWRENTMNKIKKENESLVQSSNELFEKIDQLEKENEKLRKANKNLMTKNSHLSQQEKDLNIEIQRRTAELAQEKAKNADLNSRLNAEEEAKKYHIYQMDEGGHLLDTFESFGDAAKASGVSSGMIFKALITEDHKGGDYIWKTDLVQDDEQI